MKTATKLRLRFENSLDAHEQALSRLDGGEVEKLLPQVRAQKQESERYGEEGVHTDVNGKED